MIKKNSFFIQETKQDCDKYGKFHDFTSLNRCKGGSQEICKRCKTIVYFNKGINNEFDNSTYLDFHSMDFLQPEEYLRESNQSFN